MEIQDFTLCKDGCFEFAKILKNYIKGAKIVINKDNNHCGIVYSGSVYDAKGKVDKVKDFKIANLEDIKYMESRFGIPEKTYISGKRISDYLIEEINNYNIDKLIDSLEGQER